MTSAATLEAARDLIKDPEKWCQGSFAVSNEGRPLSLFLARDEPVKLCVLGALIKVMPLMGKEYVAATQILSNAAEWLFKTRNLVQVNDLIGHTAVMQMFDLAIKLARKAENHETESKVEKAPDANPGV